MNEPSRRLSLNRAFRRALLLIAAIAASGAPLAIDAPARAQDSPPAEAAIGQPTGTLAASDEVGAVPPPGHEWKFTLAPYLWVPAATGTVGVANRTANVDITLGDAFSALGDDFDGGFSLHVEAKYDKWSLFGDALYLKLKSESVTPTGGQLTTKFKEGIFELGAAYRLCEYKLDESGSTNLVLEPLAGVRVYYFDTTLSGSAVAASPSSINSWADVFGGVRGELSFFSNAVSIVGRADFGGGGSNFAWNALAGVNLRLATWCSLIGGYRWLSVDYDNGQGLDHFEYDVLNQGPFIAFEFRF